MLVIANILKCISIYFLNKILYIYFFLEHDEGNKKNISSYFTCILGTKTTLHGLISLEHVNKINLNTS